MACGENVNNLCLCTEKPIWELSNMLSLEHAQAMRQQCTQEGTPKFIDRGEKATVHDVCGDVGYGSYVVSESVIDFHNSFYFKDYYAEGSSEKFTVQITGRVSGLAELASRGTHPILTVKKGGISGELKAETDGKFVSGDEAMLLSAQTAICSR